MSNVTPKSNLYSDNRTGHKTSFTPLDTAQPDLQPPLVVQTLSLPFWVSFPSPLLVIMVLGTGNLLLELFYWGSTPSIERSLIPYLIAYLSLLSLSASIALLLQPRWYSSSKTHTDALRRRAESGLHTYRQLQKHNAAKAERPAPFEPYDLSLDRTLTSCRSSLELACQPLAAAADLFVERRGFWILSLGNLLMPAVYWQIRRDLNEREASLQKLERDLKAANNLHVNICRLHEPILASLAAVEAELREAIEQFDAVRTHTPRGIQAYKEELDTCEGDIRRAKRACKAYGLCPDAKQTWDGIASAHSQIGLLRNRIELVVVALAHIEHCRTAYREDLKASFQAYISFHALIKAEHQRIPHVATQRYQLVAQKIYATLRSGGNLNGPKEHYQATSAACKRIQAVIQRESDHLRRKQQAMADLVPYEEQLRAISLRLDEVHRSTPDGLEGTFAEREAARLYIDQCRTLLCDALSDAWEQKTDPRQLQIMVTDRYDRISATLDAIDALRSRREQLWAQIQQRFHRVQLDIAAMEGRKDRVDTTTFHAALAERRQELANSTRERGSQQGYSTQIERAQQLIQELEQLSASIRLKGERMDAITGYETELKQRKDRLHELKTQLPDGWSTVEGELDVITRILADVRTALVAPVPATPPAAESEEHWIIATAAETLRPGVVDRLRQLDTRFAQVEHDLTLYRKRRRQAEGAIKQLEQFVDSPQRPAVRSPSAPKGDWILDQNSSVSVEEFRTDGMRARFAEIEQTATSPAAVATYIPELYQVAHQIRRLRRELRIKRRLLASAISLDHQRIELEIDIRKFSTYVHAGLNEKVGLRQPVMDKLRFVRDKLTAPSDDWRELVRKRVLQREIAARLNEHRRNLEGVRRHWSEIDQLLHQAKAAIERFKNLCAEPVEEWRQVNLHEFTSRLADWNERTEKISNQFTSIGNPESYTSFEGELCSLIGEVQAHHSRLEQKRTIAKQIYTRLNIAADLNRQIQKTRRIAHWLSEAERTLRNVQETLEEGRDALRNASRIDWSTSITQEWLDEEAQKRFENIRADIEAAEKLDTTMHSLPKKLIDAKLLLRSMDNIMQSSINTADIDDERRVLYEQIQVVEQRRSDLYKQSLGSAYDQVQDLIAEHNDICDDASDLNRALHERKHLVEEVEKEFNRLRDDLVRFENEINRSSTSSNIDFVDLKKRIELLLERASNALRESEDETNNGNIERLRDMLRDLQDRNPNPSPRRRTTTRHSEDRLAELRQKYTDIINAYDQISMYRGFSIHIDLLSRSLRVSAPELNEEITRLSSISSDFQNKKMEKIKDTEVLTTMSEIQTLSEKLASILSEIYAIANKKFTERTKEVRINSNEYTWLCLKPDYEAMNEQFNKLRQSMTNKTATSSNSELKMVGESFSAFYRIEQKLRSAYQELTQLKQDVDKKISDFGNPPSDLKSEINQLRSKSKEARLFAEARDSLRTAITRLSEAQRQQQLTINPPKNAPPVPVRLPTSKDGDKQHPASDADKQRPPSA